ncbi:MAG: ATP-binding cassette domain-containing protein [Candidatus Woesearchaeota archaeon]
MIKIKNLSFSYSNLYYTLYNINLTIPNGGKIAIIGDDYSGKTTLLRTIVGLETPDEGQIYYGDKPIGQLNFKKDYNIGYISYDSVFFEKKSVFYNLNYVLKIRGQKNKKENQDKINQVLEQYKLINLQNEKIKNLTKFEEILVQFARVGLRKEKIDIYVLNNIFKDLKEEQIQILSSYINKLYTDKNIIILSANKQEQIKNLNMKKYYMELGSIKKGN